jgi:hypothetical protein
MSLYGDVDEATSRVLDLEAEVARLNLQLGIAEQKLAHAQAILDSERKSLKRHNCNRFVP